MNRLTLITLFTATCITHAFAADRTPVTEFKMPEAPGVTWTQWSDGTYTSNAGHESAVDPRIPLCDARTLTSRADRLKAGKPYAAECRIR